MRRAACLLASTALLAVPMAGAADARPLPEIPPTYCDPGPCPNPVEGVTGCVDGAITAIRYIIQGTPQPQECRPLGN